MLDTAFRTLGLSEKEQRVYCALADLGKSTATVLSKRTATPRATLYAVLDGLIAKGVVSREQTRRSTYFLPSNPQAFARMVSREKELLVEKERAAQDLIELLSPTLKSTAYNIPKLQLFEGKDDIESMLYDYLPAWRKSIADAGDFTLWGYQDPTFVISYSRWHEHMWETRDPREKICLFSNRDDFEKELRRKIPRREVRALPKGIRFSSSIWIYGEYIVMGITHVKPHFAVQMVDPYFSSNLRAIFRLLWSAKF